MITIKSFKDIVKLLFIYRNEARLAFILTVVLVIASAFLFPPKYHSEARILVKPGRETSTLPIEVGDRTAYVSPSTQRDPILDEELQITGRPIVAAVAEYYLSQVSNVEPVGFWQKTKFAVKKVLSSLREGISKLMIFAGLTEPQSELEKTIKKLQEKLVVTHAPGSTVIEMEFKWDDPVTAQKVLEKWISTYQEQRTVNLGRKSLYDFYENEIDRLTRQITTSKEKISKYLKTINGTGAGERLQSLTTEMDKLIHERDVARAELAGMQSGLQSTSKSMEKMPEEIVRDREVSLNPTRLDLTIKLNDLEVQRLEKLKTFKPDAPPIKEIDRNIATLKEKIEKEEITLQRAQNLAPNELLTVLKKTSYDKSSKVSELTALVAQYDKTIATMRADRDRILQLEPELSNLGRDLSFDEKSLKLYADSLEKARIDRELDNSRISNIAIIEPATFVSGRTFPNSSLLIATSIPAGIAIAILVIYLCFLSDQRIHDGDGIQERFGLPVWTTINNKEDKHISQPAMLASVYRLYGMLPLEKIQQSGLTVGLTSATRGEGVSFVAKAFGQILKEYGISSRPYEKGAPAAKPGEVVIVEASNLLEDAEALLLIRNVDVCLMLIEAKYTKVATLERGLALLNTAMRKVDGVIVNKRRLELPYTIFNWLTSAHQV